MTDAARLLARFGLALCLTVVLAGFSIGCASKNKPVAARPAAFWPPYPDEPRIQYLSSFEKSTDVAPAQSGMEKLIYGKEEEKTLSLAKPYGLAMWNGRIYVCDLRSNCVTVLDLRSKRTLMLGSTGTERLVNPVAIAIAPDGFKYVVDNMKNNITVFDPEDRYVSFFGVKDMKPVGIATFGEEAYVTDFKSQRVLVFNRRNGQLIRTIGEAGGGPGQFVRPLGIAVDKEGNVYVADVMTCKLQKFDRSGKVVTTFGTISANTGGLVRPKHIAVDQSGIIYVVDAAFQNVQLFDQQGRVLTFFGSAGGHSGAMYLPAGICISDTDLDLFQKQVHPAFQAERLVLVTNQFGPNKVAIYALGHLKPGKTIQDIANTKGMVTPGVGPLPTSGPGLEPLMGTTNPADAGMPDSTTQPAAPDGAPPAEPAVVPPATPAPPAAPAVPAR